MRAATSPWGPLLLGWPDLTPQGVPEGVLPGFSGHRNIYGQHPELKAEAWANPGSPSVAAKVLDRAAAILATKRKDAERRAYVNLLRSERMGEDPDQTAKLEAARKAAKI